ncbi:hypothetical protein H4R18_005666 [Coemansia javaensis]|uniref:JAB1/MPN/MOV34 metalloenzyme domain-containing protein n=1 Tax=Coemansia javaensis TaxID=2761396 RepID=A0A9W8H0W2_9FUNG|nr:hypothetical protein H4R18_005666 [Coemansia javaensis]
MARTQVTAVVHPLVLLNVSEHTTRTVACVRAGKASAPAVMCGALLGRRTDERVEVFLSFEVKPGADGGLDAGHFAVRLEQLKTIFPDYEPVGWYAVGAGTQPTREVARLHARVLADHPAALLLVFDAALADGPHGGAALPIAVYETLPPAPVERARLQWPQGGEGGYYVEAPGGGGGGDLVQAVRLVPVRVTLDSGEAERVAVEHVANVARLTTDGMLRGAGGDAAAAAAEGGDWSRMAAFLASQRNALEMLASDVAVLQAYVADVIADRAPFDPDVLQLVQRVLSSRPAVLGDEAFALADAQEQTDCRLAGYLAAVTGAAAAVRSLSQRANIALAGARNKHAAYVSPAPPDGMFGMAGMMGHGRHGHGRHRGFGSFR